MKMQLMTVQLKGVLLLGLRQGPQAKRFLSLGPSSPHRPARVPENTWTGSSHVQLMVSVGLWHGRVGLSGHALKFMRPA
jgi:hypothetical protein